MMAGLDGEALGQAVGVVAVAIVAAWRIVAGFRKSPSTPPPERAPSPHEVREALQEFRDLLDEFRELTKDQHHEIGRQLDRIEAQLRLADAVAAARREIGPR